MISAVAVDASPLVLVVDDDEEVRTAIEELLLSAGMEARGFGSTRDLIESPLLDQAACLVLDVRMPGSSGLDLQQRLNAVGPSRPIVFLSGHSDVRITALAMKAGAIDVLTKPVSDQTLIAAVLAGVEHDTRQRECGDGQAACRSVRAPDAKQEPGDAGRGAPPPHPADRL